MPGRCVLLRGPGARRAAGPELVLVVDPIDGTRPALAALGAACTSVAVAAYGDGDPPDARRDRRRGGRDQERGRVRGGARPRVEAPRPVSLSDTGALDRLFWAHGFARRPAEAMVRVIGELIDLSSLGGGTFDLGAAAYDLTRIITGQLDAHVEPGARMVREVPGMAQAFARVGGGQVVNNSPTTSRRRRSACRRPAAASPTRAASPSTTCPCRAPGPVPRLPAWRPPTPPPRAAARGGRAGMKRLASG